MEIEEIASEGQARNDQRFQIELGEESFISTKGAKHFRAYTIVCKRSVFGLFGHIYFVEKKSEQQYGKYMLFGGKVKYSGVKHTGRTIPLDEEEDGSTAEAVARELNEELGPVLKRSATKYRSGDFKTITSLFRDAEGGEIFAADIFSLDYEVAEKIHLHDILKHQSAQNLELKSLRRAIKSSTSEADKSELQLKIDELLEKIAGHPVRIRRLPRILGLPRMWLMFRFTFPAPLPWKFRPNWFEFAPLAAYALMTHARIRERNDR